VITFKFSRRVLQNSQSTSIMNIYRWRRNSTHPLCALITMASLVGSWPIVPFISLTYQMQAV